MNGYRSIIFLWISKSQWVKQLKCVEPIDGSKPLDGSNRETMRVQLIMFITGIRMN